MRSCHPWLWIMLAFAILISVLVSASFPGSVAFSTEREIDILWEMVEPFLDHNIKVIGHHHLYLMERFVHTFLQTVSVCQCLFLCRIHAADHTVQFFSPDGTREFPKVNCSAPYLWPRHQVNSRKKMFKFRPFDTSEDSLKNSSSSWLRTGSPLCTSCLISV